MSVWSSWFQRRLQPISAAQVWMKFLACQVSELGLQVQHVPALITDLLSVSTSVKATGQGYLKSESNFQWETLTEYLYRGLIKSFVTCCDEGQQSALSQIWRNSLQASQRNHFHEIWTEVWSQWPQHWTFDHLRPFLRNLRSQDWDQDGQNKNIKQRPSPVSPTHQHL